VRGDIDKEVGKACDTEKQDENTLEADVVEEELAAGASNENDGARAKFMHVSALLAVCRARLCREWDGCAVRYSWRPVACPRRPRRSVRVHGF